MDSMENENEDSAENEELREFITKVKDYSKKTNNPEESATWNVSSCHVLRDDECTTLRRKNANSTTIPFYRLFRFSTWIEKILIFAGILMVMLTGVMQPVMFILFGDAAGSLISFGNFMQSNETLNSTKLEEAKEMLMHDIRNFTINTIILGVLSSLCGYLSIYFITKAAIGQVSKMRSEYVKSMLNKDIGWYDMHQTGDFSSRIVQDLGKIEEALGDKFSTFVYYMSVFAIGITLSFIKGWELAIICLAYSPLSIASTRLVSSLSRKLVRKEMDAYASAGSVAEEVFSAIRTVVAFEGQEKELERYQKLIKEAKKNNIKRGIFNGIDQGLMWFLVYLAYGWSFWYGIKLILEDIEKPEEIRKYTPAKMLAVLYNIILSTWNLSQGLQFLPMFSAAKTAALKIFQIIDEKPVINLAKRDGFKDTSLKGNIKFKNVDFHYPSRKEVRILENFNLDIKQGETVALVGNSGCGKSTCIQLLQRFYDPVSGKVFLDERNINEYDLSWLRSKIGVVGQEPVLFATTIEENIKFGYLNATFEEIKAAAVTANAHNFITKLPNGYQTLVGEKGAQLSGGQKQRIAIARALVRGPSILLLDEATSALDTESEALVQSALDDASKRHTTIIVAHRLSTIRGADRIVVFNEGVVVEDGNHEELMSIKGAYYNLVLAQTKDVDLEKKHPEEKSQENKLPKLKQTLSNSIDEEEVQEEKKTIKMSGFEISKRILIMNRKEWWAIILGIIGAVVQGACIPFFCIVFSEILGILSSPDSNFVRSEGTKYSMYFGVIGAVSFLSTFCQWYLFSISGEELTFRARSRMFETMMNQEIGWFDRTENGVGALGTKLSNEASAIQGASGQSIGTVLNSLSSLGIAFVIAFYYDWRISLVNSCFVPLIFICIYCEGLIANSESTGSKTAIENSSKVAVEAIGNIRTVSALCIEDIFLKKYVQYLKPHSIHSLKSAHMRGAVLGFSRSLIYFTRAVVIYYGTTLLRDGEIAGVSVLYKVSEVLTLGSWAVGNAVAFTPNIQRGFASARKLFQLLNRVPAIQDNPASTSSVSLSANVHYRNIKFTYPTRPNIKVLKGLSLDIFHGKTVALVGPSGCGKSTLIQLLERFYDPNEGNLSVNDENVKNMKLSSLRMRLGIVSQEANLFDKTILENIAYGCNSRQVSRDECIEAAKKANIHNFITSLPLDYDTPLGEKGAQLSGGQKQRIAIARALVRNPQILLLDEATSALDAESEKVVQIALDEARKGRTCITIAHRLNTIQDADLIVVIDRGVVAEMGTHHELLEQRGIYYKLNGLQMGHK